MITAVAVPMFGSAIAAIYSADSLLSIPIPFADNRIRLQLVTYENRPRSDEFLLLTRTMVKTSISTRSHMMARASAFGNIFRCITEERQIPA